MSTATFQPHGLLPDSQKPMGYLARRLLLRCSVCDHPLGTVDPLQPTEEPSCTACGFVLTRSDGIWRALAPRREERFQQFIQDYEAVRAKEGRGSDASEFYLSLPFKDITRRNSWQWKIRGRSYRFLERSILPQLEKAYPGGLDIVDIGAGNCWMSYRLALRGHRPVAVDLLLNDQDGLGAARHTFKVLRQPFPRFQAEMDRLPFGDRQFDLVVFNASFHYSENYGRTLQEALRCLRRAGHILIIDTPYYNREESGKVMAEERHAEFQKRYGFRSESLSCGEFVTAPILESLAREKGIKWKISKPWYGLNWALRPVRAQMLGRREPCKFYIWWGTAEAS
jgi:SAM-dependent methyltransferase